MTRNSDDENLFPSSMAFITLSPFAILLGCLLQFKPWKALKENNIESDNLHQLTQKLRYIQYLSTIASIYIINIYIYILVYKYNRGEPEE